MFSHDAPRIVFTKDFRQLVHGTLQPGAAVRIVYDAERLPEERSEQQGQKAWTIQAFYKFTEQGEVHTVDLWSETGVVLTKTTNEPGEGTMVVSDIDLPSDADHLTLWFLNTGKSGAQYWDSNFGRNYIFRFVADDLHIESVSVARDQKGPLSWFQIEMQALPEVSDLEVVYQIMNHPEEARREHRMGLTPGASIIKGERAWTGRTAVPEDAVVRFTLAYTAYGNPHQDTNSGKGYLSWQGAKKNLEAGVL